MILWLKVVVYWKIAAPQLVRLFELLLFLEWNSELFSYWESTDIFVYGVYKNEVIIPQVSSEYYFLVFLVFD